MTCFYPIPCARGVDLRTGQIGVYFSAQPPKGVQYLEGMSVPCGKCIGCRLDHSRMWAIRCVHEAKLHDNNCFLTLTYNNEHLPENGSLVKKHMQDFWKRLRKEIYPQKVRYFQCGEYGSQLMRPHYHAVVFGFDFQDKKLFNIRNGSYLYRSAMLERLWPYGFTTIGDVTFESCAYVARYCMKKIGGEKAKEHYGARIPEYVCMSRRPGIGHDWLQKYMSDVYTDDVCMMRKGTNGVIIPLRPPRYYDAIYDIIDPDSMARIKEKRKSFFHDSHDLSQHNSSYYVDLYRENRRLEALEYQKRSQAKLLIRPFEELSKNE